MTPITPKMAIRSEKSGIMKFSSNRPSIFSSSDIGTQFQQRTLGLGMLIGMLGMTYPESIIIGGGS
jgi:hypothetical protein